MTNLYDACKKIGKEEKYENHFFYDTKENTVYVVGALLNKMEAESFLEHLNQTNNNLSIKLVKNVGNGERNEYLVFREYMFCGKTLLTNKNPAPVNQKSLEKLIFYEKIKRRCKKAGDEIKRIYLEPACKNLNRKNECKECEEEWDDFEED